MAASAQAAVFNGTPDLLRVLAQRQTEARAAGVPYLRSIPGHQSMAYWLAKACAGARLNAGRLQVHVAASANLSQSSVDRFEDGSVWPRNPDRYIAAYAEDLDVDPIELWETAIQMWKADLATQSDPRDEAALAAESRTQQPATKRKPAAKARAGQRRPRRAA